MLSEWFGERDNMFFSEGESGDEHFSGFQLKCERSAL